MSLFKRTYTTRGLYIGKPEAEAENGGPIGKRQSFFEDFLDIDSQVKNGSFIISGRKGSGKSAYAGQLVAKARKDENLYCELVKRNDFDLEEAVQTLSKEEVKYEALFEWIILTRMVKLIIQSEIAKYHSLGRALEDFYHKNSGLVDIDQYVIAEVLSNQEVNFAPLKKSFGFFSRVFGTKSIKAPFYKMISPLREAVKDTLALPLFQNTQFYVLFDDLDVKFKLSREADRVMMMDLIRIVRRYNTEYFADIPATILVFIRDDIADRLGGVDCDKNKIFSSYGYDINWYDHDMAQKDENNVLLRQLINKRLRVAFTELNIPFDSTDPWKSFVLESENEYKSSFKYILDHTFYLPRDIITIFKDVGNKSLPLPLNHNDVNTLLKEYSKTKKSEIEDELFALYDEAQIKSIFNCLRDISSTWDPDYEQVLNIVQKNGLHAEDFQNMLDYSLVIPVDRKGHMYFNYREQKMSDDYGLYTFNTPKILSLYFKHF